MTKTGSVHDLIKDLCKHHLDPKTCSVAANGIHLSRLKSEAYKTLLCSSNVRSNSSLSTIDRLLAFAFKLRQKGKYDDAGRLEGLVGKMGSRWKCESVESVLRFLLLLVNAAHANDPKSIGSSVWMTLTSKSRKFDEGTIEDQPPVYGEEPAQRSRYFMQFPSQVFEDVTPLVETSEQTESINIFELMPGMNENGGHLSCAGMVDYPRMDNCMSGDLFGGLRCNLPKKSNLNVKLDIPELNDYIDESFVLSDRPKRIHKLSQTSEAISEDEGFLDHEVGPAPSGEIWEMVATMEPNRFFTWETIGRHDVKKEKPFVTEAGCRFVDKIHSMVVGNLLTVNPALYARIPDADLVDQPQLVADVVNLLVGVPSTSFIKKENVLSLRPGIHIEGVTPDATASLLSSFVSTANNFLKLSSLTSMQSTINHQGLVSQAFISAIGLYLSSYQATVLMLPQNVTLLQLNTMTSKLRSQMSFLTDFFKLTSNGHSLPFGIDLLSYIYKTAVENSHTEHYALLLYFLRTACQPYLRFLQDWLFEGKCDDVFGEYMIQGDETYLSCRDRSYWTHGYVLLQSSAHESNVPVFLQDSGKDIFLCGKSFNLLKLCNPNHNLCKIKPGKVPELAMNFSKTAIRLSNEKCEKYACQVRYLAQKSSSTREQHQLMEEADRRRQALLAKHQAAEEIARITSQELRDRKELFERKKKQLVLLKDQMEQDIARRKKTKEENARQDALMADKAEFERQEMILQHKNEMQMRRQKMHENSQANLVQAKLRRRRSRSESDEMTRATYRSSLEVDDVSICRMSITEDDDGSLPTFNLNDVKPESPKVDRVTPESINNNNPPYDRPKNLNESIDDELNSNILTNDFANVNLANAYNRFKDKQAHQEGLICAASMTIARQAAKSRFGHASDSSIQKLLYSDYENRNVCAKADEADGGRKPSFLPFSTDAKGHKVETSSVRSVSFASESEDASPISLNNQESLCKSIFSPDSPLVEFADCEVPTTQFCYTKAFPDLDESPNVALMSSRLSQADATEDDEDIQASLNLPLSVLLKQSLLKVIFTQVNLVNKSVVEYFMVELQINDHFKALRNFLFLYDGEFGHMLSEQLFKEISHCAGASQVLNPMTLNNLLSRSLASSLNGDCAFADNLSFALKQTDEPVRNDPFSILDCLRLSYDVAWPHNVIITDKDLVRYNKVFTFVIQIKYSIWALNEVFFHLKRRSSSFDGCPQHRQLQIYRHEMQHFARVLQSYVVSQVLLVTWQDFQRKLADDVRNIDELRRAHSVYLNEACFKCLLNEKAAFVMKIVQDVFGLILKFRTQLMAHEWKFSPRAGFVEHPKFQLLASIYREFQRYAKFLCKVLKMLQERGYQPHISEFLLRLDFNEHYIKNS